MNFPRQVVLDLCAKYGPQLKVHGDLVGKYVMAAIAYNESSLGANCTPRLEPAWDTGGVYAKDPEQVQLLEEYGQDAAKSYGIWQLMFYNCPGYTPTELINDPDACARCFLAYFNGYVQRKGAVTLEQIGQVYNGGHVFGDHVPQEIKDYTDHLALHYVAVTKMF